MSDPKTFNGEEDKFFGTHNVLRYTHKRTTTLDKHVMKRRTYINVPSSFGTYTHQM